MPPSEKPITSVPSTDVDLPEIPSHRSIGEPVGDAPAKGRRVRDVLHEPHYAKVFCEGPHPSQRRRWVAVLTKENPPRLVTDGPEDVEYVDGGVRFVFAPCDSCSVDQGQRLLSVALLKQARALGETEISLDDVLWQPESNGGLGKREVHP